VQVTRAVSAKQTMRDEPDSALLYYISCRNGAEDRSVSDAATAEFYKRYAVSLLNRCRRICDQFGSTFDAHDLFSATIAKAIDRADTFDLADEAASGRRRTLGWLARIARNLLVDTLRNPRRSGPLTGVQEPIPFEDYSAEEFAALFCDGVTLPRDLHTIRLVQEAFVTLDERTRQILTHTVLQRQRSPKGSYVFRGEMAALAKRLGTTPVNLRRIRSIGVKALANYVRMRTEKV